MKAKILFALILIAQAAMAQKVVTGVVTETLGSSQEPIIGANVTFVNSQNRILSGTVTDFNGNYSLKVPADKGQLTLVVSYVGMKTQRFAYKGQASLNVKMGGNDHQIREVQVSGSRNRRNEMGVTERQMSFATQKVNLEDITATAPVTSVEEALQGRLGGVDILNSGDPGAKSTIRIRGTATLNSNV